MKNKYFYPIYKLKIKSWIKYWLIKQTEFKGVLSDILEGTSFYLTDSLNMKFKMFKIYGRTTQDGDPTPTNPIPIKNTGDNVNLFDKDNANILNAYFSDNVITSNSVNRTFYLKCKPNTAYTITKAKTNYFVIGCTSKVPEIGDTVINKINGPSGNYDGTTVSQVYTTDSTAQYIVCRFYQTSLDTAISLEDVLASIKIEQGTKATPSSPYGCGNVNEKVSNSDGTQEQNISFPLAQGQKLYQDEELKENEKDDIWSEYIFTGEENWTLYSETENELKAYSTGPRLGRTNNMESTKDAFCTHFKNNTFYSSTNGIGLTQNATYVSVSKTIASNVSELKSWFATQYTNETPVKVQYKKKNPTTTPYTEEQQQYYDEHIKPLRTYKNVTHISSEDETPALLKIQYWKEG